MKAGERQDECEPEASVPQGEGEAAAVWTPIDQIHPWEGNPRKNDEAVKEVVRSIRRFGFGAPLVVRKADHVLIAGHTRLKAAQKLGLKFVPVRFLDLDPADAHLLALADNKTGELAEWDDQKLGELLEELRAQDLDLLTGTGFDTGEIERLIREAGGVSIGEDPGPVEPPANPRSLVGEIYELGPHRLMCGDATNAEHVRLLMAGARAPLCATDPPYLVDYDSPSEQVSKTRPKGGKPKWDTFVDAETSVAFFSKYLQVAIAEALTENPALYQWHAHRRQSLVEKAWVETGLLLHQQIIWAKSHGTLSRSDYMWSHEPCFYGWIQGMRPSLRPVPGTLTVWQIEGESEGIHPTQKPLEIFERPIGYHTRVGDCVYEPFGGSGSQLIAAAKLGRCCYAMELAPEFCDAIRMRWTKYARSAGLDPGAGALEGD